jgi:membrane protein YqaA with SNARE-associated domain
MVGFWNEPETQAYPAPCLAGNRRVMHAFAQRCCGMKKPRLPQWLKRALIFSAAHRYYPLVVTLICFISTVTFSFPFAAVLVPAILLAPRRWISIGLLCGIASGCAAAVLVEIFRYVGSEFVLGRYPELIQLEGWQWASEWLQRYGLIVMLMIAASPMPQTPALFFCALANLPTLGILIAVGIGKAAKYLFLGWATARYPGRFVRYT